MNEDWTGVIFGMGVLILGTVILVVVLILAGRLLAIRQQRAEDSRYVELTEQYAELAARVASGQESAAETLADIQARTAEVERMLREVD